MNEHQKIMVTQAICNRFEHYQGFVNKDRFTDDVRALISAVKLVNQPELVAAGVNVAVDSNKDFVNSLNVSSEVVAGVIPSNGGDAGISAGSAKVGLSINEFIQAVESSNSVIFVVGHK